VSASAEASDDAWAAPAPPPTPERVAPRDEPILLPAPFESVLTDSDDSRGDEGVALAPREAEPAEVAEVVAGALAEVRVVPEPPSSSDAALPLDAVSASATRTRWGARERRGIRPLLVVRAAVIALCLVSGGFLLGRWREQAGPHEGVGPPSVQAAPPAPSVPSEVEVPDPYARPAASTSNPSPVLVHVNARPWAHISIDGRDQGDTPLGNLPLAPGLHRFRAELPSGRVLERLVLIDARNRHVSFP